MEPITTAAVAVALAQGLSQVGGKLLEKGVVEPALEPAVEQMKGWLGRAAVSKKEDEVLRKALQSAMRDYQQATGDTDLQVQALLSSLHILTAEKNSALRAEIARTLWLMDGPDPAQTSEALPSALGLSSKMRGPLAAFLWQLKRQLAAQESFKSLFAFDQDAVVRRALGQMTDYLALLAAAVTPTPEGPAVRMLPVERQPDATELAHLRREYLAYLTDDCRWLEFAGIMQVRDIPRLPMAEIFVPLRTTPPAQLRPERALLEAERIEQKVPLQELLPRYPRLVVLGDPGSGKTTFLKYVALALAEGPIVAHDRLGLNFEADPDARPWLPVLFPIAAYVEALKETPNLALRDFLPAYFRGRALPDLEPLLRSELKAGRCLLLLDGLDEVGSPGDRQMAVGRLADLVRACPGNRFVVTSRIAGYDQAPLNTDEFTHLTIQPFDDDDIARFAGQWCLAYETRGDVVRADAEARAETRAERLVADIHSDPNITRLAANPLLLSILALIHYQNVQLPRRRVELYSLCVKTLAETWNRARGLGDRPINLYLGDEPLDERFVVDVLGPLAYWMHEHCPERVVERRDLEEQLAERLAEYGQVSRLKARNLADDFIQLMVEKTGLLAPRGLDLFGFLHLTFEEYLAARYLIDWVEDYRAEAQRLAADPRWWEVVRLAAAALPGRWVGELVGAVLDAGLAGENLGRDVVLAGWCAVDAGRAAVGRPVMKRLLARLEQVMRGTDDGGRSFDPPLIPATTRAEAGRALADLGWLPDDPDEMVDVPAGEFLMGSPPEEIERLKAEVKAAIDSGELKVEGVGPDELYRIYAGWLGDEAPQRRVSVPAFRIAKYPVTNAQFGCFVDDRGYQNEAYWSPEGWAWLRRTAEEEKSLPDYRQRAGRAEPGFWHDPRFNRPNAPVMGLTWYEAEAYCRWLSAREGKDYRLPSEAMWEKAARGGLEIPSVGATHASLLRENPLPQRRYPWGDDFDPQRANTWEGGIGQPTAVGVYPLGASPYGVQDMIGNVWEWCADWFGPYRDPHEPPEDGDFRLLRGGAWYFGLWFTRCAIRFSGSPGNWDNNVGFRVAEYL
jgi:formylglycine-generating enzyme required for sulfatase activity